MTSGLKRLNLMKSLAGVKWGMDRYILRFYYVYIQSRLDYGSQVYGAASLSLLHKLDVFKKYSHSYSLGSIQVLPSHSPSGRILTVTLMLHPPYLHLHQSCILLQLLCPPLPPPQTEWGTTSWPPTISHTFCRESSLLLCLPPGDSPLFSHSRENFSFGPLVSFLFLDMLVTSHIHNMVKGTLSGARQDSIHHPPAHPIPQLSTHIYTDGSWLPVSPFVSAIFIPVHFITTA